MVAQINSLSSTMEDYLETILALKQNNGFARIGKIASKLNVKSSSVNSAIKYLSDQKLVVHEKYGYVGLTKEGEKAACDVKSRHDILFRFLTEFLMLDPKETEKEACCIEHSISKKTFERLTKFFKFLENDFTAGKPKTLQSLAIYLKTGKS
jgi:DtxR family transcriptional regulator, Mn-dependent transcriptional regulator